MKVLLVDHNPDARGVMQASLIGHGYDLFEAATGAAAIAIAERECPEVALLDLVMPDLSGFEVCRRLRASATTRETAVIIVAELIDDESRRQGFEAGADDFIAKPINRAELRARLAALARLTRFPRLADERQRRDGSFTADVTVGSRDASGSPIPQVRDVTERTRLKERVLHLEAISSISSGVAHDVANPLIAVKRAIESALADRAHRADAGLEKAARLIDQTTDLVRQMNRLGAPHEWTPRPVDPNAEIRGMAPLLRHLAEGTHLYFELQHAPAEVRVDPLDLKQILMNLTSNAVRAVADDGSVTIRSFRGSTPQGAAAAHDWWYVHVADDGAGMPAEVARLAFDPYFTTHEASGGSGVGLSTVRTLVVRNRGRIRLDTGDGTGTTVSVGFPVATDEPDMRQE